ESFDRSPKRGSRDEVNIENAATRGRDIPDGTGQSTHAALAIVLSFEPVLLSLRSEFTCSIQSKQHAGSFLSFSNWLAATPVRGDGEWANRRFIRSAGVKWDNLIYPTLRPRRRRLA